MSPIRMYVHTYKLYLFWSDYAVALVCENRHLQNQLSDRGIDVETISEAQISCHSPLSILSAKSLGAAYQRLGVNNKMGLSGRQQQKMGVLSTSQLYVYEGNYYAFTPQVGPSPQDHCCHTQCRCCVMWTCAVHATYIHTCMCIDVCLIYMCVVLVRN